MSTKTPSATLVLSLRIVTFATYSVQLRASEREGSKKIGMNQ